MNFKLFFETLDKELLPLLSFTYSDTYNGIILIFGTLSWISIGVSPILAYDEAYYQSVYSLPVIDILTITNTIMVFCNAPRAGFGSPPPSVSELAKILIREGVFPANTFDEITLDHESSLITTVVPPQLVPEPDTIITTLTEPASNLTEIQNSSITTSLSSISSVDAEVVEGSKQIAATSNFIQDRFNIKDISDVDNYSESERSNNNYTSLNDLLQTISDQQLLLSALKIAGEIMNLSSCVTNEASKCFVLNIQSLLS